MSAEPLSRGERKQRTRKALLDAALGLVADRPFAGLSLREVARAAGVVPTAFYRHFASMDELGIALVEESARTLRRMLRSARTGAGSYNDAIRASVALLHEHVRGYEDHFRFLVRERHAGSGPVRRAVVTELQRFAGELAVDLARFEYLRTWSTEDLRMMADLIVVAMLATVVDLLEARPRDAETDAEITERAQRSLRLIVLGAANWRSTG